MMGVVNIEKTWGKKGAKQNDKLIDGVQMSRKGDMGSSATRRRGLKALSVDHLRDAHPHLMGGGGLTRKGLVPLQL